MDYYYVVCLLFFKQSAFVAEEEVQMYFLIVFTPTNERAVYQTDQSMEKFTVKDLLDWICKRFHFESSSGESGNRRLALFYEHTELQNEWFLQDINIRFGATIKCSVKEDRIPDYRLFLAIRSETFDIFDSKLHPIETTILQLRIIASRRSGLPLSAFRLITDGNNELFDHVRLSKYDIDYRATLTIQTWVGWSDFFTYAIKGYTKAVLKLLSSDELVRQYMLQVALYIAAHYGNVDLARALLQLGARADRPVGHHPSRQWCSSESLHPEYFRCPVHEAIASQQVGIVLLFGTRDVAILHKPDGYGVKPWRLALQQERSVKQREIALFLLSKQFGGTRLSSKITVSHRHTYVLKQWADRAREQVYAKQGLQYSSLKRKPLPNNAQSLLGYKVLVDGFNNNFQDYYSTAEYAKEKNRMASVVLDERERWKLKHVENYMKRFNEANPAQAKTLATNISSIQPGRTSLPQPIPSNITGTSVGKKLWTKVANLFRLETLLLRNAIDLLDAGLITDDASPAPSRHNNPGHANVAASRSPSSLSSASTTNLYLPIRIRLFAPQLGAIRKMMYKPDKDGRTLRHLSGVEWSRVRVGQNNAWKTHRASTALKSVEKFRQQKLKAQKKRRSDFLPNIQQRELSSAKIPLPFERQKVDYRIILRANDDLHKEIMYEWENASHLTLPTLSVQCLTEACKFQRKSWMQQVDTAVQFAINHSRRTFKNASSI